MTTKSRLAKKTKLWRIDATIDDTLESNVTALSHFYARAATKQKAWIRLIRSYRMRPRQEGGCPGIFGIHTEETLIGEVHL